MLKCGVLLGLWSTCLVLLGAVAFDAQPAKNPGAASAPQYVGGEVCAKCHAAIAESYSRTHMAHASGRAVENFIPADFTDAASSVHYRISEQEGEVWLSFDRPGEPTLHGQRKLLYYIGSGYRGLTYLFSTDGFVFELPINWYGKRGVWDMTPAYQNMKEIPLNLPAFTSCLHCHVSEMRPPIDGTENRYAAPLFVHAGVTCERCHGPGSVHVKGGPIVNPAKLTPERRDHVCMQCHLEGKVAIERSGRHVYEYHPGDNLFDFIRYYVLTDKSKLGAVSQVEAMSESVCKKKSGDHMSCTSCHDPHESPSAERRVSYYRGKCVACHGAKFGGKHYPGQPDCTGCHMPSFQSKDVAHTQVTDHRIPRRPEVSHQLPESAGTARLRLVPFPAGSNTQDDVRDLALAWESLTVSGVEAAAPEAERLLRSSLRTSPNDSAVLSALGYIEQKRGASDRARELYQKALAYDPNSIEAATNLGVIEAQAGHLREATRLWEGAFHRVPGRSEIGMNIARVFCETGKIDEARSFTMRVLEFNPDLSAAKKLLQGLNQTPVSCGS